MKRIRLTLNVLAIFLSSLTAVNVANAQATRTWVSGVGDDANPCSRTAPCKTFAGAISKTAAGGEINALDSGGFGGVTITKSISIEAVGTLAGVLVSGTNAIIINAPVGAEVVLRGLTIEGLGTGLDGIKFLGGAALHVENCTINNFTGLGINFNPAAPAALFVKDTIVRSNAGGGIVMRSASASIDNVRAERNLFGIRADDNSDVTINRTVATGNTNNGFAVASGLAAVDMNIYNSVSSNNGSSAGNGGLRSAGAGATIRIQNVTITNNFNGLNTASSGVIASWGNNYIAGNVVDGLPTTTLIQH
jgi:hypothetical protein